MDVVEVSRAYVAGEETALLAGLEGKPPKPRMRPPFPATQGLWGRPTLVQNVETLANVALLNAYGADWFRTAGTDNDPGTGLFSVGCFDEDFELFERPFGTSLRSLLEDAGLADGLGAVLVGGYSGGLLRPDQLDVGLSLSALNGVGARLGTKSVQVLPEGTCPLRRVIAVLRFFAAETAEQCPPCYRGLPEMADLLQQVEDGGGREQSVGEVREVHGDDERPQPLRLARRRRHDSALVPTQLRRRSRAAPAVGMSAQLA